MRIKGHTLGTEDFDTFVNALRDAFGPKEFKIMLRDKMGWSVLDSEADDSIFTYMLDKAEKDEVTQELLAAALVKKPRSSLLNDFAHQIGFPSQEQLLTTPSVLPSSANLSPQLSTQSLLERQVSKLHSSLQPVQWRKLMEKCERQICLITVQGWEKTQGTGFLVGPDVIMTNYHVLKDVIDGPIPPSKVFIYFDYKLKEDGKSLEGGSEHQLANDHWRLDHSEYDDLDRQSTEQCVDVDERHLDYTLLRLKRKAGEELIDGIQRGWIEIPEIEYSFKPGAALLILHHPKGGVLTFDIDTRSVMEENTTKTRVRYTTNTERGSSGAPCFNVNWELVALHQGGDPDFTHSAHYNQGIPIVAILRRLKRQGNEKYLGGRRKKKQ